jgi:release factor glutamine methyltransferase
MSAPSDSDAATAAAERENFDSLGAYERGTQPFMGLELYAAPGALVPRPETELLAKTALRVLGGLVTPPGAGLRVIDMCCGSGNLACAIASGQPGARVWACDLTDPCVALTKRNVEKLGLGERVMVGQGDLFAGLSDEGLEGSIDAVVCNPPYISSSRLAQRDDLQPEPKEAFDGGPYGLSIHQRVIKDALVFLKPGGWLLFEFGLGQSKQLRLLFDRARAYEAFELVSNEANEPRVAAARKKIESA